MEREPDHVDTNLGLSRRTLIRRGAILGGTLVWAAPVVQSIARPAMAHHEGTPSCDVKVEVTANGSRVCTQYHQDNRCCDCIEQQESAGADAFTAIMTCAFSGACDFSSANIIGTC